MRYDYVSSVVASGLFLFCFALLFSCVLGVSASTWTYLQRIFAPHLTSPSKLVQD